MRRYHRRQDDSAPPVPTVSGFNGASTAGTQTASTLVLNPTATPARTDTSPVDPNTVTTTSSTSSSSSAPVAGADGASAASSSQISLGTVIGACVGVFAACALLLLIVYWTIRRSRLRKGSSKHLSKHDTTFFSSSPVSHTRNTQQNNERRKSARQTWLKMKDDDEEKYAMRETGVNRSITMKTHRTDKSYGADLGLAHTFKSDPAPQLEFTDPAMAGVHAPFARSEGPISWGGDTVVHQSFLSLKSVDALDLSMDLKKSDQTADGTMSPSLVLSKQTRQATTDVVSLHQWHEAEFVTPSAESTNNVFARQQDSDSESNVVYSTPVTSPIDHETENPFMSRNPFHDDHAIAHSTTGSIDTILGTERGDRAMQSLLAALAISEDDAKERLAAAQPTPRESVQSQMTMDTVTDISVSKFPMPPGHFN